MAEVQLSEAMILLNHVWECARRVKPFSDTRFEVAMHDAMELAIKSGLNFSKEDCFKINDKFCLGGGYFKHHVLQFGDEFYLKAIIAHNISACHSFELCVGRKPFIADNVDHPWHYMSMPSRRDITRPRDRLGLGSKFTWQGERVTVTSFNDKDEENKVIVCSYQPEKRDGKGFVTGPVKVKRIYKLTHKDLKGG